MLIIKKNINKKMITPLMTIFEWQCPVTLSLNPTSQDPQDNSKLVNELIRIIKDTKIVWCSKEDMSQQLCIVLLSNGCLIWNDEKYVLDIEDICMICKRLTSQKWPLFVTEKKPRIIRQLEQILKSNHIYSQNRLVTLSSKIQ
jgi:hypothetical protein